MVREALWPGDGNSADHVFSLSIGMPAQIPSHVAVENSLSGNRASLKTCVGVVGISVVNRGLTYGANKLHLEIHCLTAGIRDPEENAQVVFRGVIRRIFECVEDSVE